MLYVTSMRYLVLLLILFCSCRTKSPETFLEDARAINRELLAVVRGIDDLDGLMDAYPHLSQLYMQLVEVMIQAHRYRIKHNIDWEPTEEDSILSSELAIEFARIYQIPTARAIIEKCQEKALERLDAFQKKQLK